MSTLDDIDTFTTFTIDAAELTRLVSTVQPFAGRGSSKIRYLGQVHLQTAGDGRLYAEATDSHRAMRARTAPIDAPGGIDLMLPVNNLAAALKPFKTRKHEALPLTCRLAADKLTLTCRRGDTSVWCLHDPGFPNLSNLFAGLINARGADRETTPGIDPTMLRDLPKLSDNEPAQLLTGPHHRPLGIYTDSWFAIFMPRRLDNSTLVPWTI